jgi:hypothetical protein
MINNGCEMNRKPDVVEVPEQGRGAMFFVLHLPVDTV